MTIKYLIAPIALLLAACSAVPPRGPLAPLPVGTEPGADPCNSRSFAYLIGRMAEEAENALRGKAHRIVWPGSAQTMDYGPGRLNVHLDAPRGKVVGLRCG
jgi:hypothetical protein